MFFDKQKVIDIALAEVGYREKATDAMLDEKFANAGPGNHTKYGRDMNKIDPLTMDYADAWCDAFVDWCFVQAFGVENARGLLAVPSMTTRPFPRSSSRTRCRGIRVDRKWATRSSSGAVSASIIRASFMR